MIRSWLGWRLALGSWVQRCGYGAIHSYEMSSVDPNMNRCNTKGFLGECGCNTKGSVFGELK